MMRKQIAAANWKMNLTYQQAGELLDELMKQPLSLNDQQHVVFGVPAPYLHLAKEKIGNKQHVHVAAQNVYSKKSGAFTGETSVEMLVSLGVDHAIIGHSERREYFNEDNQLLADKIRICLDNDIYPIFCCGEPLPIRETDQQNDYVSKQLEESLFQLSETDVQKIVIAYEPIWAIGTGRTATSAQAQEMHAHIRKLLANKYGDSIANSISILYGGSVKGANAKELFSQPDVDGGLVGGASLHAKEFGEIIAGLK